MNDTLYMYIFIRRDLSPMYQIIQAAHATHEAGLRFGGKNDTTFFVLIGADDQNDLQKISMYLTINDIPFEMFHEPDYNTGYTAIATKPLTDKQRKCLRKFKLYQGEMK